MISSNACLRFKKIMQIRSNTEVSCKTQSDLFTEVSQCFFNRTDFMIFWLLAGANRKISWIIHPVIIVLRFTSKRPLHIQYNTIHYSEKKLMFSPVIVDYHEGAMMSCNMSWWLSSVLSWLKKLAADGDVSRREMANCIISLLFLGLPSAAK